VSHTPTFVFNVFTVDVFPSFTAVDIFLSTPLVL